MVRLRAAQAESSPHARQLCAAGSQIGLAGKPHSDDAPIDSVFVASLQTQLLPAAEAMDKGSKAERAKLATLVQLVGGGRRVDVLMVGGCESDTPKRLAQKAGFSLETLLIHGVLVIRCNDRLRERPNHAYALWYLGKANFILNEYPVNGRISCH